MIAWHIAYSVRPISSIRWSKLQGKSTQVLWTLFSVRLSMWDVGCGFVLLQRSVQYVLLPCWCSCALAPRRSLLFHHLSLSPTHPPTLTFTFTHALSLFRTAFVPSPYHLCLFACFPTLKDCLCIWLSRAGLPTRITSIFNCRRDAFKLWLPFNLTSLTILVSVYCPTPTQIVSLFSSDSTLFCSLSCYPAASVAGYRGWCRLLPNGEQLI